MNAVQTLLALHQKGYELQPDGSYAKAEALAPRVPDPVPQQHVGAALDDASRDEAGRPARLVVRFTRYACRLTDFDNGVGGIKYVCDCLRYEGLIPNDDPGSIDLQFRQVRVNSRAEEGTLIEIEPQPATSS